MIFNLVLIVFTFLVVAMLLLGVPCNSAPHWIPAIVKELYAYGKFSPESFTQRFAAAILVPKRWFLHFYVFAFLYAVAAFAFTWAKYFCSSEYPSYLAQYLDLTASHSGPALSDPASHFLAQSLFLCQVSRRLYENAAVSVFSDAKMNIIHYLVGYLHYWGCSTVLLAYAPPLTLPGESIWAELGIRHAIGVLLFLFGFYYQFQAHTTLAALRQDPGHRQRYFVPHGGLFEYVSCPNYLCEIVVYVGLQVVLGFDHFPWTLITVWVVINQTLVATTTQAWYQQKFDDYPAARRAILPFVY